MESEPRPAEAPSAHVDEDPSSPSYISSLAESDQLRYHREVARIGAEVAEALGYAHRRGVLHRDIKPSNLLLDARGTAWVTDFGLAKFDGSENLTETGDFVGTLRYMAPERFDGRSDARCDIYALGVTLYEMLALRPPFDDTNRAMLVRRILDHTPTPLRKLDPRISLDLSTVVAQGDGPRACRPLRLGRSSWPTNCGGSSRTSRSGRGASPCSSNTGGGASGTP